MSDIYKDVNDFNIQKKLFKAESFYLFHSCKLNCVKDINNRNSLSCFK